jgi:hypothetical protein
LEKSGILSASHGSAHTTKLDYTPNAYKVHLKAF